MDALRVRWPDAVIQAELNQGAGFVRLAELDRKPSSCPVLFAWDGTRFAYVTDCLGAGSVGEESADGSTRPPRPEESMKIEPGRLADLSHDYRGICGKARGRTLPSRGWSRDEPCERDGRDRSHEMAQTSIIAGR